MSERYECDCCGACCRTFPIFATREDARREPRIASETVELKPWQECPERAFQLHPLPFHESCAFLGSDNLCTVYETRPGVCRRFQAGSEECQEARRRVGIKPLEAVSGQ